MKLRFWPLLWIVWVPLESVGAWPQPALAVTPTSAVGVAGASAAWAVAPPLSARIAAAARHARKDLDLDIR